MIWLLIWLVGFLIFAPILGRFCASIYRKHPRKAHQVSPITYGLTYGLFWPIMVPLILACHLYDNLTGVSVPGWFRKFMTGTTENF